VLAVMRVIHYLFSLQYLIQELSTEGQIIIATTTTKATWSRRANSVTGVL